MNAQLIVSVTAVVLCVAITIAVFFALNGDSNAASYNYRVSFSTKWVNDWDGAVAGTGSGTVVVNSGVQSFTYTQGTHVHVQEADGFAYISQDTGATFDCMGDLGSLDYGSATPQAVASSLTTISSWPPDTDPDFSCAAGEDIHSVNSWDTDYFICSTGGVPSTVFTNTFRSTATSYEMHKTEAYPGVTVPSSATVNLNQCSDRYNVAGCSVGGFDFEAPKFCCESLAAVYAGTGDSCQKYDACFGSCSNNVPSSYQEGSEFTTLCASAESTFLTACATNPNRILSGTSTNWRDELKPPHAMKFAPKRAANPKKVDMEIRLREATESNIEAEKGRRDLRETNRIRLVEQHGEDFHRHLSEEEVERRLAAVNVCFMHGMGCADDCHKTDYWGDMASVLGLSSSKVHYMNTDSKYCDYTKSGSSSWSKCKGSSASSFISSSGSLNNGVSKGSRGSLPVQYKRFIDMNDCNVIFAHSMGNPTMAELINKLNGGSVGSYGWYNSNGPMRGSQAAHVVYEYCNDDIDWWDWGSYALWGVASAMGYCGSGSNAHNALTSMRPTGKDRTTRGTKTSCSLTNTRGCGSHYEKHYAKAYGLASSSQSYHNCGKGAKCKSAVYSDSGNIKTTGGGYSGIKGAMCGNGNGYGLGGGADGDGHAKNIALRGIHALTDYGEGSDGMVGYSSCKILNKSFGTHWKYTWYESNQSHLDGTCFTSEGSTTKEMPCSWFKWRVKNAGVRRSLEEGEGCGGWKNEANGKCTAWNTGGWCSNLGVQVLCPCTCEA